MTDSEFKSLVAESKVRAHRALFDEYCGYVYAIAVNKLRCCGSREDIEECVSDIFASVYRTLDRTELHKGDLKGLISVIAKRTAIDAYRKISSSNRETISIDDENVREISSEENIEEQAERSERRRILLDKVKELGEPDSTIIMQQFFYNRTASEIASSISMTAGAVQKRSSRAREKLRVMLTEVGISL